MECGACIWLSFPSLGATSACPETSENYAFFVSLTSTPSRSDVGFQVTEQGRQARCPPAESGWKPNFQFPSRRLKRPLGGWEIPNRFREQRRRSLRYACRLLWRKRSDNCSKARIAAHRVPKRIEAQMAIAQIVRQFSRLSQSLDCAVLVARPRINHGQILDQQWALDGAFANGHQLDCALAFADGIPLISQNSIDHTERA